MVDELRDDDPAAASSRPSATRWATARPSRRPAIREVVENLVHAGFRDAVVSVLDGGFTVRVSDHGPGIDDPVPRPPARILHGRPRGPRDGARRRRRASRSPPGSWMRRGGRLELADNLGGGAVVTLSAPAPDVPAPEPVCSEAARVILALLLEIGQRPAPRDSPRSSDAPAPSADGSWPPCSTAGLVAREPGGARRLTDSGAALVATLF